MHIVYECFRVAYKRQELFTRHPRFSVGPCCSSFQCFVLSYYVSLHSEFRVVMSVTISALKRYSVRLYLQLFVGGLMSYLRYLCLFVYSGIQHILCCVVFLLCFSSSCVPFVASFSGLSFFDCPFGIL
jgi:hypothetical protein